MAFELGRPGGPTLVFWVLGCRVSVCGIVHSAVRRREMTSLVSSHRVGRDLSLQKCALGVWGKPEEETGGRMEQCSTTNAIHKVCSNLSIFSRLLFGPTSVTGTRSKTRLRREKIVSAQAHRDILLWHPQEHARSISRKCKTYINIKNY